MLVVQILVKTSQDNFENTINLENDFQLVYDLTVKETNIIEAINPQRGDILIENKKTKIIKHLRTK